MNISEYSLRCPSQRLDCKRTGQKHSQAVFERRRGLSRFIEASVVINKLDSPKLLAADLLCVLDALEVRAPTPREAAVTDPHTRGEEGRGGSW